jgi:hypothetical protein
MNEQFTRQGSAYLDKLKNDNVFPPVELVKLSTLAQLPTRRGLENAIISGGQIVNVVSEKYSHLPNENFFLEVERALIDADLHYITQSINRDNRSFAVDYILQDERYTVSVKSGADEIVPMLRFTNGYDGSTAPSGKFGFFRKVCANGLHVAHTNVGFKVKHRGQIEQVVLPEIARLVEQFMNNEFYQIQRKFEVLAETPIHDLSRFVQIVCKQTGVFKFEKSDNNPDPGKLARQVIDIAQAETVALDYGRPNAWVTYNAFNEVLHREMKKTFENQRQLDTAIFNEILSWA